MYFIFKFLFVIVALISGCWWVLIAILAVFEPETFIMGPPVIILVGAPILIFLSLAPLRMMNKRNRSQLQKMINKYVQENNLAQDLLGPTVASEEKATAFAFYNQEEVILASALGGENYVKRFNIDDLAWREIRDNNGDYLGVEAFPPAFERPKKGTLKILTGPIIPGEARAIYGVKGIPLP